MTGRITEIDTGSKNRLRFELEDGAGFIELVKKKRAKRMLWVVGEIRVDPTRRRLRLGTRLYEHAAKEACKRRLPLASDERIGSMSEPFWQKQLAKGRAKQLCVRCSTQGGPVYALSCPAPVSLEGARKRRR